MGSSSEVGFGAILIFLMPVWAGGTEYSEGGVGRDEKESWHK